MHQKVGLSYSAMKLSEISQKHRQGNDGLMVLLLAMVVVVIAVVVVV